MQEWNRYAAGGVPMTINQTVSQKLLVVVFACMLGSCQRYCGERDLVNQRNCNHQLCATPFKALRLGGIGILAIQFSGAGPFFKVSSQTSKTILDKFAFVQTDGGFATAYGGKLDGSFMWSKELREPVLEIERLSETTRLPSAQRERLIQEFKRS
jgi:hypothetical protein